MKILALTLLAAFVLGCGMMNDDGGSEPAPSTSSSPSEPTPAPASKADAPSSTQPSQIVGVPDGWDLAPRAKYTARQSGGQVTIKATGENPTGGYQTKLFQSPLRIWPPQYILAHKKPDGPVTQAITPYEATAAFKADRKVATVVVNDAAGRRLVSVLQEDK